MSFYRQVTSDGDDSGQATTGTMAGLWSSDKETELPTSAKRTATVNTNNKNATAVVDDDDDDGDSTQSVSPVNADPEKSSGPHGVTSDSKEIAVEEATTAAVGVLPIAQTVDAEKRVLERSTSQESTSDSDVAGVDDESQYKGGLSLVLLTVGLALSTFCVALDNTILATALPKITTQFDALNDVGWIGSSYLLTTTSLQPSFGKVYSFFNIKYTYIIALIIFELGSVLCGAAVNSTMLIIGRAVAGCGAAALFSGAMIIIGHTVPLRQRPIYIGLLSSIFGISSVVGPLLGGAFTDRVTWRWCFYINLPLGGVAVAVVVFFFTNPERKETKLSFKEKLKNIDLAGAVLLICAVVCLLLALQWGGSTYPWSDSRVWGCLLGFGLIVSVFTGLQFYLGERATIPPRIILKQRTIFACAFFSVFLAMALYTHIYYLPFYFQAVKGTSAEASGIRTIPYLLSNTIAAVIVGGAITTLGPYAPFTWFGSAVFCVGSGLLYTLEVNSGPGKWIGYQILAGAGSGACVQIPFIAVQVVLPKKDMAVGNAVAIFFNTLGGAVSISIAQNIFSNTLVQQLPKLAPNVNPEAILTAGATHIRDVTPPGSLQGVVTAYNYAVTHAFILAIACTGIAFMFSFLFEWKSVKGKKLAMGGA